MGNSYKDILMSNSSALDAMTNSGGKITHIAHAIVKGNNAESTQQFLNVLALIAKEYNNNQQIKVIVKNVHENLIKYYGELKIRELCTIDNLPVGNEPQKTLLELLEELNSLVGLQSVKDKVNDLIAFHKIQQLRKQYGLAVSKNTLHLAFTGNPGTGKTTVARIVGRIYKHIGLLSKGHFLEVSRTDLIAGYQGQTALKVKKVIEKAKGGVLFIDEAYSITENENSDSYGRECLTELTKALEDYREDLVVIVAGYTEPMNRFFESNPGLKSRFNTFIEFKDYKINELVDIFLHLCKTNDYALKRPTIDALEECIRQSICENDKNFGNGRFVRNLYETVIKRQACRLSTMDNISLEKLAEIKIEDIVDDSSAHLGKE